jgi:hypothetical protein
MNGSLLGFSTPTGGVLSATVRAEGKFSNFGDPGRSEFVDEVRYSLNGKDITFSTVSFAVLKELKDISNQIYFDFTGTGKVTSASKSEATFTWNGKIEGGGGVFLKVPTSGTFEAKGKLFGMKHEIEITKLTVIY